MSDEQNPVCKDDQQRRADLRALAEINPLVNGIDFVEVDPADHRLLHVFFLLPVGPADAANPGDAFDIYGIRADKKKVAITGGTRIVGIKVESVVRQIDGHLVITVDKAGDFSIYTLTISDVADFDPFFSQISFSFMASCPVDFDCREQVICPTPALKEPLIDYLAKDYASFRKLLLDLIPQLNPQFVERNPSDQGIALLELLAYTGDNISYFQDAVAGEAYLETVRHRISARRHARLIDYRVHDGRNAWAYVHIVVDPSATVFKITTQSLEGLKSEGVPGPIRAQLEAIKNQERIGETSFLSLVSGTIGPDQAAIYELRLLEYASASTFKQGARILTRIVGPLLGELLAPGRSIDENKITPDNMERDPALSSAIVFETTHRASFLPRNNEIVLHTWGDEECCLRPGTTEAYLYSVDPVTGVASRPVLNKGDYLLLEEVKGPLTGASADANPANRQVVLIDQEPDDGGGGLVDPLYTNTLIGGALIRFQSGATPLPLLKVRWLREDGLRFPLCLSARHPGQEAIRNISVARGNIVLADHGLTTEETIKRQSAVAADARFRLHLSRGPLTMQCMPDELDYDPTSGVLKNERRDLNCDVRKAAPAVSLLVTFDKSLAAELWTAVPDLLDSTPFAQEFVAEVDDEGRAVLRFGDGEYGREVAGAISFRAVYRVGNGRAGMIGAEALAHVALPAAANWIKDIRNPLPAQDAAEAETIEEVRQHAPQAFHAEQFRAVTEGDYVAAARKLPDVAGAVASFRWTGSWYTVFVGIDPHDQSDLILETRGRIRLSPRLERRVRAHLTRFRLAGYDLEIRPPQFVPIELALDVCTAQGYFRGDVARAVAIALSSQILPNGARGFFHPDNFTFGQPVYLSQIYAAVERVEGVDSVVITTFHRYGQADNGELDTGVMPINAWEIAQLENDPNFMEHGVLHITAQGGKA